MTFFGSTFCFTMRTVCILPTSYLVTLRFIIVIGIRNIWLVSSARSVSLLILPPDYWDWHFGNLVDCELFSIYYLLRRLRLAEIQMHAHSIMAWETG
jgi:hypothetical protein